MTIINQKSISGITSITTAAAGDNLLTVHTNDGTERARVSSGGLIGIGTVSPSGPIHAHVASGTQRSYLEASAAHSFLRLKSGSTSYNSGLEFFSGASNIANINGLGAGGLQFEVNGSERLRITSDGKIGIGNTTSPTADLEVAGTTGTASTIFVNAPTHSASIVSQSVLKFGYAHSGSPNAVAEIKLIEDSANSFNGNLTFGVPSNNGSGGSSTSEALRIKSNGNIGIGTVNPSSLLHLNTDGTALRVTRGSSIGFLYNTGTNSTDATRLQGNSGPVEIYTNAAQPIKVVVNGTEEARFLSGGGLTFNGDTAAANALDDYEEGTFNPVLEGTSTAGSATYNNQEGAYTKVGRLVTCFINMSITNKGGMAGDVRISGLPFTVDNVIAGTGVDGGGFVNYHQNIADSAITGFGLLPDQGTDNATFYFRKEGVSMGGLEPADINSNFNFRAVVIYCNE